MADDESVEHIVNTVSNFAIDWIAGFINDIRNLASVCSEVPSNLRYVGLPADFPFMAGDFSEVFHWVQLSSNPNTQTHIGIRVHFTFHSQSGHDLQSFLVWSVHSGALTRPSKIPQC
jgi:hypothetical protein